VAHVEMDAEALMPRGQEMLDRRKSIFYGSIFKEEPRRPSERLGYEEKIIYKETVSQ